MKQHGGLVDKGASAAGTTAIHPNIRHFALFKENHLAVFAAHVDECAHLGIALPHRFGRRHHLLHKTDVQPLGIAHSYRARDDQPHLHIPQLLV